MATIWEVLGLDGPTSDEKLIKKAYARKLRETRPEEDRDGFMHLRQAFDQARNVARSGVLNDTSHDADDDDANKTSQLFENTTEKMPDQDNDYADVSDPIHEAPERVDTQHMFQSQAPSFKDIMSEKIQTMLRSPWKRNSSVEWEKLFNSEALDHIDAENEFEHILREELLMFFGYYEDDESLHNQNQKQPILTPEVATFIFKRMQWQDLSHFDYAAKYGLRFLANDLGVQFYDPDAEIDSHVQSLQHEEESYLFYSRITVCCLMLIGGLILTFLSLSDGRVSLFTIAGVILLLRSVRMWFVIYRDHL